MSNEKFEPIQLQVAPSLPSPAQRVLSVGVPLPVGAVTDSSELCICSVQEVCLPCVVSVTSRWGDGSIRWCMIKFIPDHTSSDFTIQVGAGPSQELRTPVVVSEDSGLSVTVGDLTCQFPPDSIFPVIRAGDSQPIGSWELKIAGEGGTPVKCEFESAVLESHDDLTALVIVSGVASVADNKRLNLKLSYQISADQNLSLTVGLHNPGRAQHHEGIWDLGDPGSVFIDQFELMLFCADATDVLLQAEPDKEWMSDSTMSLYQASSGGENWQSPAHVNRHNQCSNEFCGYQIQTSAGEPQTGARATPVLIIGDSGQTKLSIVPREFWQNFPKRIAIEKSSINFGIFPSITDDCHEIQGGERKQHTFEISLASDLDALKSSVAGVQPSRLVVESGAYENAQVLGTPVGAAHKPYEELLQQSFDSQRGFLAKREIQDEFGWRNFGDVVADHETLYHDGDGYFISHYNNQYDCVYGFARQYLLTGDSRWFQLMDELARHVVDIDIYHTDEDRAEYNHGLFWHTDHYQKASTASHRTYSRDHYADDWTGPRGGGPGPEHCYTSGLKVCYFLTGNHDARQAVIGMTEWISNYYDGTGTLVEFCKTVLSKDVKKLIASLRKQQVFRYQYPFDRGVGNYIRALLDSFELTGDHAYMVNAERVVCSTFGAADDIEMRNLEDIEHTWYYTVFLQEVVRFLDIKREQNELDNGFQHARDGLLHYACWMAEHERPYLEQPEKLEYPNDTWAAQEIRKANVLYAAYLYANTSREPLLSQARYFRDYVIKTLSQSDTLYFARIQALLLQNHGPSGLMTEESPPHKGVVDLPAKSLKDNESLYQISDFFKALISGIIRVIRNFNPKREYQWVRTRLGR